MKNIAKMLSLLLAVVLVLGITSCGGKESEENTTSSTAAPVTSVTEPLTSDPTTFVPPEEDNKSKENGELSNGVYKNKWADISFKMPDGWKDITSEIAFENSSAKLVFASRDKSAIDGIYSNINVIVDKLTSVNVSSSAEYANITHQTFAASLKAQGIEAVVDDTVETLNLGENEYFAIRSACTRGDVDCIIYSLCRVVDSHAVVITLTVPNDEAAADLFTFLTCTHEEYDGQKG